MYETAGVWCDVGSDRNAMSVFVKTDIASCCQFSPKSVSSSACINLGTCR